jgi:hypothetical protein
MGGQIGAQNETLIFIEPDSDDGKLCSCFKDKVSAAHFRQVMKITFHELVIAKSLVHLYNHLAPSKSLTAVYLKFDEV